MTNIIYPYDFYDLYDPKWSKKELDNSDTNLQKKNKELKYSKEKFCDRFIRNKRR